MNIHIGIKFQFKVSRKLPLRILGPFWYVHWRGLFGANVLGYVLRPFGECMFCQFTRQKQSHCSLNFPASDSGSFVVMRQPRSFGSNAFENVIDETVHDAHSFWTDACIRMDLLQNLINVNCIALLPFAIFFLSLLEIFFCVLPAFFSSFTWHLWRHLSNSKPKTYRKQPNVLGGRLAGSASRRRLFYIAIPA